MAGEWTKFEDDLPAKRETIAIGRALGLHHERVACKLMAVWAWARRNTADGAVHGVALKDIDWQVRHKGFGNAMKDVGWVEVVDNGLVFPKWDRHNSNGAKSRATDARRKEEGRKSGFSPEINGTENGQMSGSQPDKIRTRAEQSRAEQELLSTNTPERPGKTRESHATVPALPALPADPEPPGPLIRRGIEQKTAEALAAKGVTEPHLDEALAQCRGDGRLRRPPMAAAIGILAKACGIELKSREKDIHGFVARIAAEREKRGIPA